MKNILVPIDFSEASANAAKYAVALAKTFGAEVVLINATAPSMIVNDSSFAPLMITQAEIVENNRRLMNEEVKTLSGEYPSKITGFVEQGFPAEVIDAFAKAKHAELIVMGMKGRGRSEAVFGSITTTTIRKSTFPVLVIPEKATYSTIRNITFASDFDAEIQMNSYTVLLELVKNFNAYVNILHVQKRDTSMNTDEAIGKMSASVAFSGLNHRFYTISERNVEEGINKFIEENPTEVLAMVAHSHSLFRRVFGKVHTRAMSYQTTIPLLVLQSR